MKKIILMFVAMIIAIASFSQKNGAQTPAQQTGAVIDTLAAKGGKIINVGKNAIAYVDTSSNFKSMYSDVKQGVIALAAGINETAETIFVALVKKQVAHSCAYLVCFILAFVFLWLSYSNFARVEYEDLLHADEQKEGQKKRAVTYETSRFNNFGTGFLIACLLCTAITLFTIKSMFAGFISPEAGAIQDVVDMVSELKKSQ